MADKRNFLLGLLDKLFVTDFSKKGAVDLAGLQSLRVKNLLSLVELSDSYVRFNGLLPRFFRERRILKLIDFDFKLTNYIAFLDAKNRQSHEQSEKGIIKK